MPRQAANQPRLDPRISAWIDAIMPATPEAPQPPNPHKRSAQHNDNNPPPAKRVTRRALRSTAGNTMPAEEKDMNTSPQRLTRSVAKNATKRKDQFRGPSVQEAEAQLDSSPFLGNAQHTSVLQAPPLYPSTRVGGHPPPRYGGFPLPAAPEASDDGIKLLGNESIARSPTNRSSSRRSQSPSKRTDLSLAERPVYFPKLRGESARQAGGFLAKYANLRAIGQGDFVIPFSLKNLIESHVDKDDRPSLRCYIKFDEQEYDQQMWHEVVKIHNAASQCEEEGTSEAGWNQKVHKPLLDLVVNHPRYNGAVCSHDITQARIFPADLHIRNLSGEVMGGKKVDFAAGIKVKGEADKRIKYLLSKQVAESRSLNQTNYSPLRQVIVFLSMETKPPSTGGEQADVQLATWGYAGFTKLHQLLDSVENKNAILPVMPMLSAHGHYWHLSAMREEGEGNEMLGKMMLGTTETIQGIFQILKALELLVEWGHTDYRRWYYANVLGLK